MQVEMSDKTVINATITGTGQPVVFVNGFGSYQQVWTAQIQPLVSWGFQTITFDYRGQGQSNGQVATGLDQLASDLHDLMRQLHLKKSVLIGHSMGSAVIWNYLQQYHAAQVAAIVTIDESPKMINTADWPYGFMQLTENNAKSYLEHHPVAHETLHGMVPAVMSAFIKAEVHAPFMYESGKYLLKTHYEADWRDVLTQIQVPALLVTAKQSPYFKNGYGHWLETQNPNIREVIIPNCGHDIMAEVPEAFEQTLRHFLWQLGTN